MAGRYIKYNPNPKRARVGDCTVRAISKATGKSWDTVYAALAAQGYAMADMPNANNVWGAYLKKQGFVQRAVPDTCPDCYTVDDFCRDHPKGVYVLALAGHVVGCEDGFYFDSFDSGDEALIYFWERKDSK